MSDSLHLLAPIPPKYTVAQVAGFNKIKRHTNSPNLRWEQKHFTEEGFRVRGCQVSPAGKDKAFVR